MLNSFLALSSPAAAASLNDLSPRPVRSNASPIFKTGPLGELLPVGVAFLLAHAAATRPTTASSATVLIALLISPSSGHPLSHAYETTGRAVAHGRVRPRRTVLWWMGPY